MGFPHDHWKTTTVAAGLTLRGMVAPFVLSGPINRDAFETYVERVLVPELRPSDIVIPPRAAARVPSRDRIERLLTLDG